MHRLGPDIFLLEALRKRAKERRFARKEEIMCSGWRIRFAKVSTFAFPTNSYSMQSKFPFGDFSGLQCCQWLNRTGCPWSRVKSHHTPSSASPAAGVLPWGPEGLCPTALNPADPRQSSKKCRKKEDVLFSGPQSHFVCHCNKMCETRK